MTNEAVRLVFQRLGLRDLSIEYTISLLALPRLCQTC